MLKTIEHDEVVEISMDRPPVNAMTTEFLEAMQQQHTDLVEQGARAIIISGREGLFSAGLDVPALIEEDRAGMERFWTVFFGLMKQLAGSPVPVASAITGHSPAGGMVLAVHTDFRVATRGEYSLGLNEVQVGLPVSRNVLCALEWVVGARQAGVLATGGQLLSPEQALSVGMVDQLADSGEAVEQCLIWARHLLTLPPVAMNKTRLGSKSEWLEKTAETVAYSRIATDAWFSDETRRMMKQLVANLQSK
jgi:3,2-trans-enoyl-CoA isomerase